MGLCRPECDGHRGPDLPQTWRPWGPGRKPPAAAQSGPHQPVCPVGPGGPGPQAGTGQPPPTIQAPGRGGVRVFKHELSPPTPGAERAHDPTPDSASTLPSQQPVHTEALGAGRESCHGRGQDRQADGTPSLACVPPPGSPSCVPRAWGSSAGRTSPQGGRRTGGARPTDADPQAGVSVFLMAASPGRGGPEMLWALRT